MKKKESSFSEGRNNSSLNQSVFSEEKASQGLTDELFGAATNRSTESNLFDTPSSQYDQAIQDQLESNSKRQRRQLIGENSSSEHDRTKKVHRKKDILKIRTRQSLQSPIDQFTLSQHNDNRRTNEQVFSEDISSTVKTHGVAVIRNVLSKELLKRLATEAVRWREKVCKQLESYHRLNWKEDDGTSNSIRFREVAIRCRGRMDARYIHDGLSEGVNLKPPFWLEHSLLNAVVQNLLHPGCHLTAAEHSPKLVYAGWIYSFPGSVDQPWHQDGMPLFPTGSHTLPAYAINVFIPLTDEDSALESGPTEFIAGSHRMTETSAMRCTELSSSSDSIVSPALSQGDMLIYDYRICHRGTANLTKSKRSEGRVRTILYLMYARPWFKEHLNFGTESLFSE